MFEIFCGIFHSDRGNRRPPPPAAEPPMPGTMVTRTCPVCGAETLQRVLHVDRWSVTFWCPQCVIPSDVARGDLARSVEPADEAQPMILGPNPWRSNRDVLVAGGRQ